MKLIIVALLISALQSSFASAAEEAPSSVIESKSTLQTIQERLRVRTFTEFMTPAVNNNLNQVPDPDGNTLMPTNTFNIVWADYEIFKDTKVVYWQRFNMNLANTYGGPSEVGPNVVLRNPRFAIRRVNVFNVPNLQTTYDLYIQPGLAVEASPKGRNVESGFRTSTSYSFPGSRWSIGAVTEATFALSTEGVTDRANVYGWMMSWASYDLNKTFATQHFFTYNFEHNRGTSGLQWDTPMPYIQNGIGANITSKVWASLFLNNYVATLPTLSNTWASLWLSMTIL